MLQKTTSFAGTDKGNGGNHVSSEDKSAIERFITLLRSGEDIDEKLFVIIYSIVQSWFRGKVYARTEDEYLDVIDEVFVRLFDRRKSFRGSSPGELYCYCYSILRTILEGEKNYRKRMGLSESLDEVRIPDGRGHPVKGVEMNMELDDLHDCINKLPTAQRTIVLDIITGMPKGDIAKKMKISPSILSRNINKIMTLLRECLVSKGYSRQFEFDM